MALPRGISNAALVITEQPAECGAIRTRCPVCALACRMHMGGEPVSTIAGTPGVSRVKIFRVLSSHENEAVRAHDPASENQH
jgi:hypothetical protein